MIFSIIIGIISYSILSFLSTNNLTTIGVLIIISALTATGIINFLHTSWYALVFFLIYITGILVLISYFLAITHNSDNTPNKEVNWYFIEYSIIQIPITTYITFIGFDYPSYEFEYDAVVLLIPNYLPIYWTLIMMLLITLLIVVSLTFNAPNSIRNYEE